MRSHLKSRRSNKMSTNCDVNCEWIRRRGRLPSHMNDWVVAGRDCSSKSVVAHQPRVLIILPLYQNYPRLVRQYHRPAAATGEDFRFVSKRKNDDHWGVKTISGTMFGLLACSDYSSQTFSFGLVSGNERPKSPTFYKLATTITVRLRQQRRRPTTITNT
jgi:hypothetical protein